MIWLIIKLLIKSQKSQKKFIKNNSETLTNENDKEMPEKDIYLQEKDKKLLTIWD